MTKSACAVAAVVGLLAILGLFFLVSLGIGNMLCRLAGPDNMCGHIFGTAAWGTAVGLVLTIIAGFLFAMWKVLYDSCKSYWGK